MKRVLAILVMFTVLMAFVKPNVSLAAIKEADLEAFSKAEGFKNAEEFKNYYQHYFYDYELEEISSVEELKRILGPRLTEASVEKLIFEYGFNDREELTEMLIGYDELEKGKTIEGTFIYLNALNGILYFFEERQTPITEDSLKDVLETFDMTLDELKQLLAENGDSLDNYEYIEDLEAAIIKYSSYDEVAGGLEELGLTEDEIEKVLKHVLSIDFEDPALEKRMIALLERLDSLPDFDSASDLTQAQIEEIASVFTELLDIFQIKAKYYLVKDGEKTTSLSLNELLVLETTNGADLLVELYSTSGNLLADIIITAEMFGSELIIEDVQEIAKPITKPIADPVKKPSKKVDRTIKGGKLPNTAGNYAGGILAGMLLIGIGSGLLIKRKRNAA